MVYSKRTKEIGRRWSSKRAGTIMFVIVSFVWHVIISAGIIALRVEAENEIHSSKSHDGIRSDYAYLVSRRNGYIPDYSRSLGKFLCIMK